MTHVRRLGLERALLALFVLSGFAGLIYQAIWSHYLGLSLGHAAYAQTLVLAIFMGGMAIGAWLVSVFGVHWRRLILAYAVIEIVIGLAGLGFHTLFVWYTGFSQETVYPALSGEAAVRAWQWGSAALIILPQCILLGMTFPLMSGGYLRLAPDADGEILGGLYFSNSVGAAFGALVATFVLLPWIGMPGTVATAGVLNLVVGVLAYFVARHADGLAPLPASAPAPAPPPTKPSTAGSPLPLGAFTALMLGATFFSGAASFVYEIGWVRMLNQVLGTTVHSFELMLSAFILGLAFGGWWIRRRSERITDPVAYAGLAQVWMGVAALASLPVFAQSFQWVGWLMSALPRDDGGYTWFMFASAGISMLVMFPAAFFAGMTLPLFTMALLRRGAGEASIGRIYAANTLGAILGVTLAVHVLIPLLGLRFALVLAAVVDILIGLVLLQRYAVSVPRRAFQVAAAAVVAGLLLSLLFGQASPRAVASGVFRHGNASLDEDTHIHFLRDGKTATIAFYSQGTSGTIATNGKPDASIQVNPAEPPSADEITMIMAAALPLAAHPDPKDVAIIGWGSGLSTHTMLGSTRPQRVESIEIERAMVEGARNYGNRVWRAYEDPRSIVHIDDARTFFATGRRGFDVIVSEPSNPWVSGVASLFTREFYAFLRNHLNEGGLLVQWLQAYELGDHLLGTMMVALAEEFPHVDIYLTNTGDLLFLAGTAPIPALDYSRFTEPDLRAELARVGLGNIGGFKVRKVGDRDTLRAIGALAGSEPHTDFYPVVSLNAPRDRFAQRSAEIHTLVMGTGMPVLEMTGAREPASVADDVLYEDISFGAVDHWVARDLRSLLLGEAAVYVPQLNQELAARVAQLQALSTQPLDAEGRSDWLDITAALAEYSLGFLPADDHVGVWIEPEWIAPEQLDDGMAALLAAYEATARRDAAAMETRALAALDALGSDATPMIANQMLLIARLGAIGQGRREQAVAYEQELGQRIPASSRPYGFSRAYLNAWLDVTGD